MPANLSVFPGLTPPPLSAPLGRVRAIARVMIKLVPLVALLVLAGTLAVVLNPQWLAAAMAGQVGLAPDAVTVTPMTQVLVLVVAAVPLGIALYALWQAQKLFLGYAAGEVFTTGAALLLRRIALAVVVLAGLKPVVRSALSVALTVYNEPGRRMLTVSISSDDLLIALVGGLLLAVAWVMVEASRLADENARFI